MVLGVGLGEPPEEYTAYGETADRRVVAEKLDEALEVLTAMWSGKPFGHDGQHYQVEEAQFLPPPVQRPRIPIWAACVVPHTAPLRRAARWDGVVMAAIGESGTLDPVAPAQVRRAVDLVAEQRDPDAGPFDVAISHTGIPGDGELAAYAEAGVTWVMATGWVDQLDDLIQLAGTAPT